MATRENGAFAVEWLLVLSREEDLFFNPRSGEKNLMQVVERFMPGSTLDSIHAVEDRPETFRYDFAFKTAQRDIFFNVYVNSIETWLDVSESNPGLGGSSIYAAVATFANNNGLTFVGDPDGLSDLALRRRLDNMLCSAIKYGSTDHLAPHPDQITGCERLGVPPLRWVRGQTLDNIQHMIETVIASLVSVVPEITHAYYDFHAKTFCDSEGRQLLEPVFGSWSHYLAGGGKASAGITTFKRCILLRSLVRQESSARPLLLEQVLCDSRQFVDHGDLFGIFY
ncbi:hypothetical protein QN375_24700 [Pseudomonas sp. MH9.2]|uniref:hypothetical protein n=1 Tax=unclassified Pseudomonas TaxID=196821 RepID=UPI002AC97165|nr:MULTISPECIES: hypothetical protein [unclassified Pseudomonas]MEB0028930.1 hypothetical protein [Pseudomonas sp. MH9.2]MEE3508374.1 hypothetical protein [Pseudomonas sp. 10C3]WPX68604.1 hypothetical protein RHM55_23275 [Pseudomonas sp. MH9.2]